jgi:3-hydroxyacyl-[acyl-carrier-protein] dehydratase
MMDRGAVEAVLPHRDPFLLIDRVMTCDSAGGIVVARYNLDSADAIFAGHFPGQPILPGVLQVEAIAQAGLIFCIRQEETYGRSAVHLTHILGARFMLPITPGGDIEILARVFIEEPFYIIVGQCIYRDDVCSVAAVQVI